MICADTNAVIAFLNGGSETLTERFREGFARNELALPAPVLAELWFGAMKSARPKENCARIVDFLEAPVIFLPLDADDAREAGEIRADLGRKGTPIGPYDILIAAQARRRAAVLVTGNGREFGRVPGLLVEDWSAT
jgi:tRNA(fMet)-specific endonuclease VapC